MQPDNDIGVTETDLFKISKLKWLYNLIYIQDIIKCKYYFHNGNNELPWCGIQPLE